MMLLESLFARPQLPKWLGGKGKSATDPTSFLQTAIEREFLYRGSSTLEIKSLTLDTKSKTAGVEWYTRPLSQNDDRLRYKPWAQLFIEQTLEDTAKVLKTTWTQLPNLAIITLKVWRRPLLPQNAPEESVVLLRATGEVCRQAVLSWGKTNPTSLLQHCEVGYEIDPRLGLRGLAEETGR